MDGFSKGHKALSGEVISKLTSRRLLVELQTKNAVQLLVTEACRRSLASRSTENHFVCVLCMDHGAHPPVVEALNSLVHAIIRHDVVASSALPHADVFVCSPELLVWFVSHHRASLQLLHQLIIVDSQALFYATKDFTQTMKALKVELVNKMRNIFGMICF